MLKQPLTLSTLYTTVKQRLQALEMTPEQLDAESRLLIENVTGFHTNLRLVAPDTPICPKHQSELQLLLDKRVQERQPLQYLLGHADFYGLNLEVTRDVLIPRPETELLVHYALEYAAQHLGKHFPYIDQNPIRILDIGTGSGAIAIALKHKLGVNAQVTAVDISPKALEVAKSNAKRYTADIRFLEGDVFQPLIKGEHFQLIVSNPPYIGEAEKADMAPEVLDYEPHLALFAPNDYRPAIYKQIAQEAHQWLLPGGAIFVELGQGLAPDVDALFKQAGFEGLKAHEDFAKIPRVFEAHYPA